MVDPAGIVIKNGSKALRPKHYNIANLPAIAFAKTRVTGLRA
jgi:hypothetical protein